jgi:hypothetical protein
VPEIDLRISPNGPLTRLASDMGTGNTVMIVVCYLGIATISLSTGCPRLRKATLYLQLHHIKFCTNVNTNVRRFMRLEPLISHTGILMTFYLSIILDLQNFFH